MAQYVRAIVNRIGNIEDITRFRAMAGAGDPER
jgi:hypothetical protein